MSKTGKKLYQISIVNKNVAGIKLLFEKGAINVKTENINGVPILMEAVSQGSVSIVDYLCEKGAFVDVQSKSLGVSPLMKSVSFQNKHLTLILLRYGANPSLHNFG